MTAADDEFFHPLVTTEWLAARLARRAQKWEPVLREKARQNTSLIIGRDSEIAPNDLGAEDVRVIDGSWRMPGNPPARSAFDQRRIPGAAFFDLDAVADRSTPLPHMLPAPQVFADAVGALGVRNHDQVVIYDDAGIFSAARVWWTFRAMGHQRTAVLDGGLPKWIREGRAIETGAPRMSPAAYGAPAKTTLARTADDVRRMLTARDGVLLDARPAARFFGEAPEPRPNLRSGHMPGAVNLPHSLLVSESGELRPIDELARLFRDRGVHSDTAVITSCGSGVTAAVLCLALERLGSRNYGLYDGSWAEWGMATNDPSIFPVVTEKAE